MDYNRKYLYHSYKNEDEIGKAIILTVICLILNVFILFIPFIWIRCFIKCSSNNKKLSKNKKILEKRKYYEN